MEEKELFEDYELRGWKLTPKIYKIIGAAAMLELLAFVIVGQFNLLQTKACDNAYVGKVCQVLDAAYIGSKIIGEGDWISDSNYDHNHIQDLDPNEVQLIEVEPPFIYPDGYFAKDSVEIASIEPGTTGYDPLVPASTPPDSFPTPNPLDRRNQIPIPNNGGLISKKQNLPKINHQPIKGPLPTIGDMTANKGDDSGNKPPKVTPSPKTTPTPAPTPGNEVAGNNGETPSEDVLKFQPNKKPLEDLRDDVKEKVAKKEVDLKAPFSITVDGVLTKDGKLDTDPKKTRYINPQGDPKMLDLAKSAIEAVNASGMFTYLDKLGGKHIIITLQQDKDNFSALLQSRIDTEEQAKTLASGFKLLLSTGKMLRKGKDEEVLLNSATVTNQGKNFIINFAVPQQTAQDLIQKQLTAPPAENPTPPNSTTTNQTNIKAGK
jgi:hypothetical protein